MSHSMEQGVIVRDVQMKFTSMIWFMVKWAIAAIPAMIILCIVGSIVIGFTVGIGTGAITGARWLNRADGSIAAHDVKRPRLDSSGELPIRLGGTLASGAITATALRCTRGPAGNLSLSGVVVNRTSSRLPEVELRIAILDESASQVAQIPVTTGAISPQATRSFEVYFNEERAAALEVVGITVR